MSTVIQERPIDFGEVNADIIETSTGKRIRMASAVRWVWQPFRDIKLFDNTGPAFLNNLTLQDDPKKGLHPVEILKRCQPYPLTNCEYNIPLHEQKRYGLTGDFLAENDLPNNYAGPTPTSGTRQVVETKFAYSCAEELSARYAEEFGFVVLEPLTGNEDSTVVRQIFDMVQPFTYKLSTLKIELAEGAIERIKRSTHPKEIKQLAEKCRKLMVKGCDKALAKAFKDHGDFSMQIQMASAGHKGNRAAPSDYDVEIADHLGVEVPRVVNTVKAKNISEELLARLAERELNRDDGQEDLRALLDEERRARKELEELVRRNLNGRVDAAKPSPQVA